MSSHNTGNSNFNAAANSAEAARQAAAVPGASQTTITNAEIVYYRACVKAAIANGISPSVFLQALYDLGWQT